MTQPRPITRRLLLQGAAVGAGAWAAGPVLWRRPGWAATPPPAGVHLAYGADPRSQAVVSWSSSGAVEGASVDVGVDTGYGRTISAVTMTVSGTPSLYHHGVVDGLAPGTTYHYRARHQGAEPVTGTFTTAPVGPAAFRFATFGDMGATAEAAMVVDQVVAAAPDLAFVVGDLCYADRDGGISEGPFPPVNEAAWDQWLALVQASAAAIPWMTLAGNHEMETGHGELGYEGYLGRFVLPGNGAPGTDTTWSARYGNVGFVALDANDASYEIPRNRGYAGAAQDRWLAETLGALRADPAVDFVVVGFHHCAYCTNAVHGSDGGVRDRWAALFDEHGVDLVVNGHNHSYERTHPVRGGAPTTEVAVGATATAAEHGTTYVTAGGGGQASYPTHLHPASFFTNEQGLRVPEAAPWSAVRVIGHSVLVVDVTPATGREPATMAATAVAADGTVIDRFTLLAEVPGPMAAPAPPDRTGGAGTAGAGSDGMLPATGGREPLTAAAAALAAGAAAAGCAAALGADRPLGARRGDDAPHSGDG